MVDIFEKIITYLQEHAGQFALSFGTALCILVVAFIVARALASFVSRLIKRAHSERAITLSPIAHTLVFALVMGAGVVTALDHMGVDVAAILAGAGILGLAVGFGAQTLVKDCLSGFFLILDDVIAQGDLVEIDGNTATVERVGIRVTQLRSFSGQLWYIPNGEIKKVGNWSRGWARAIIEVGLAYEQDVGEGLKVLQRVGEQWAKENQNVILEPPEAQGILGLNGSDVGVRLVIKINNADGIRSMAEREIKRRIKIAFDENDVEIPFPRRVVYHRGENSSKTQKTQETNMVGNS